MEKVLNREVIIEEVEKGNLLVICPSLQGCYSEGSTKAEALIMIEDVIVLHLKDRLQ